MSKKICLILLLTLLATTMQAQWSQLGQDIDGEAADDYSGWSVSISADGLTVAIGALYNDGNGADAGHVRVYQLISGVWTQQGTDIDGEAAGNWSGSSVSISADGLTVAIGAQFNDGTGAGEGHVRVYKFQSSTGMAVNWLTGLSIWPNPTAGLVNIALGNLKDVSVKVFNVIGRVVYHKENINVSIHKFEFKEAAGVYVIRITSEGDTQQYKLVKK